MIIGKLKHISICIWRNGVNADNKTGSNTKSRPISDENWLVGFKHFDEKLAESVESKDFFHNGVKENIR